MVRFEWQRWPRRRAIVFFSLILLTAACGSNPGVQRPVVGPVRPAPPAVSPPAVVKASAPSVQVEDPVLSLIASSDRHFRAGQAELAQGHVEGAREEFDAAVNVLLESSYGGRAEPRIRDHFDRLVDRISAYEVTALATGDGFVEKPSDTASIDELLAVSATLDPSLPAPQGLSEMVAADLRAIRHDVPIPVNDRVLRYIELFQGRLHDFIEEGMKRGGKYLPMIQNVFRAEGLPLDLAYVPLVESAFKPNALSRTKAKGVWQFMSGTALENGLRRDWYIDERSDPEKATLAAARYLNSLAQMFDGDWHLALASYNGGPGRLQRAIKRSGKSDFWQLAEKPLLLPQETREYVPMILAAIVIARNPAQYGFEFVPETAPSFDTITVARPVDLRRIAEWTDSSVDDVQTLNPELRRWTTPVKDGEYTMRVPAGTADRVMARLVEISDADLTSLKWYTVKRGDTLPAVAKKLRVSRADLAEANYLKGTSPITEGQRLMVPHEATLLTVARTESPAPVTNTRATARASSKLPRTASNRPVAVTAARKAPAAAVKPVRVSYQVKHGDTLTSIARSFGTDVASLITWNRLPGSVISAGDRLTIYRSTR